MLRAIQISSRLLDRMKAYFEGTGPLVHSAHFFLPWNTGFMFFIFIGLGFWSLNALYCLHILDQSCERIFRIILSLRALFLIFAIKWLRMVSIEPILFFAARHLILLNQLLEQTHPTFYRFFHLSLFFRVIYWVFFFLAFHRHCQDSARLAWGCQPSPKMISKRGDGLAAGEGGTSEGRSTFDGGSDWRMDPVLSCFKGGYSDNFPHVEVYY